MAESLSSTPPLLGRLLIANRAEIAVRIIRACRELGIEAVAIYAEGEANAPHVRQADYAYRIPSDAAVPYLDIDAIVGVAVRAGAAAVHPGYGFLAENAEFAEACGAAGLIFVGPGPAAIRAMGDKIEARRLAAQAGLPGVAGSEAGIESVAAASAWADQYGYPVAIKAAGGGGGRGFRVADNAGEIEAAFTGAAGEASRSFANPTVYIERYLERPRHVEVQILADDFGRVAVLGDRDCSIQRRHQKLIEEAPAPGLAPEVRARMAAASVALARGVDYRSAGTLEFLVNPDGSFSFLEMNTRIQVEHPVTEMITGVDIVKEQLRIAAGRPLSFRDEDVLPRGHAIECRINAEDAGRGFAPAPGTVERYREPGGFGIRVDSAMEPGGEVSAAYDSMIAKLIAWGRDRDEAIARMRRALAEFEMTGIVTTIPFHRLVLADDEFRRGAVATTFLTDRPDLTPDPSNVPAPAATQESLTEPIVAEVNGRRFVVRVPAELAISRRGDANGARLMRPELPRRPGNMVGASGDGGADLTSPIQGTVLRVPVAAGDTVRRGDVICVVEAMKMENELVAHRDGTIRELRVSPGAKVRIQDIVATIQ
ncbi:MAG: acetyl-CoA carboxylase biotin carboxylase subunit [Chloroflexota bacterium]|nr:acetyl-CoA carboxylase biotin carboxylase subunit [Chloroflexota bacterium]